MEASQEAPGSGPNAPHPNAPDVDPSADDFFGPEEGDASQGAPDPAAETPTEASNAARRWAEEAAADAAEAADSTEAEEAPTATQEPAGGTPPAAEASEVAASDQEPAQAAPAAEESPKTPERDYRVFNELKLTPEVLRALLAEFDQGDQPAPRVAYLELPLVRDRSVKGAVGKAYRQHRESIGDRPGLAICPDRNWQVKHPRPRTQPVREAIEID